MRGIVLTFSILQFVSGIAQNTFSYSSYSPQNGDQFTIGKTSTSNAGPSGANQTWNFSASTITATATYTVTAASNVPCGNQYPGATQAIGTGGTYDMINVSSTDYQYYGTTLTPSQADVIFSDPRKVYAYPMNYTNSFTDTYFGANAMPTYRYGTTTVTYDGYGTILTPYGTYSNVLRIHVYYTETDSTNNMVNCSGTRNYYYWYSPSFRYWVAKMWNTTGNCGFSSGSEFLQSVSSGVTELTNSNSFEVQPTAFSDEVTILNHLCRECRLTIYDVAGRLVKEIILQPGTTKINLDDLGKGIYIFRSGEGVTVKAVKIN